MNTKEKHTKLIKQKAKELGFHSIGISRAEFLESHASKLERWLNKNMNGEMAYMENHFDKRLDPTKLVEGAKSVISFTLNYFPNEVQNENTYFISKYAYGKDYHFVIKEKLKALLDYVGTEIGEINGRAFVDSAPVLDKAWATKSGLGWIGKHSNLIIPKQGSFFFLAELILDIELEYDSPIKDFCGNCTKCIDSCPTEAIVEPYVVDGSKCISYVTIELKNEIPNYFNEKMNDWIFGCDICQDVCPWNRFSMPHSEPYFSPNQQLLQMSKNDWKEITDELFQTIFKQSAVKRTKFSGLKRNIEFVDKKMPH